MSDQPPYGYDPRNPAQSGYPPPQQPGAYPPPPGGYSQPLYPPGPFAAPYGAPVAQPDLRGGLAIASLVLGILGLVFSCANVCDLPFIVLALVFGVLGLQSTTRRGLAIAGLATAGVGLLFALGFLAYSAATGGFHVTPIYRDY